MDEATNENIYHRSLVMNKL